MTTTMKNRRQEVLDQLHLILDDGITGTDGGDRHLRLVGETSSSSSPSSPSSSSLSSAKTTTTTTATIAATHTVVGGVPPSQTTLLSPSLLRGFEHDEEIFFLIAKLRTTTDDTLTASSSSTATSSSTASTTATRSTNISTSTKHELFSKASMLLRGKPEFMKQVIQLDPILFVYSTVDLQQDLYFALFFFSQQQQQQPHQNPQPDHASKISATTKAKAATTAEKNAIGEYIHTLDQHSSSWQSHCTRVVMQQRTFVRWLYSQLHVMFGTYFELDAHNSHNNNTNNNNTNTTSMFRTIFEQSLEEGRQELDDDTIDHFHRVILEYLYDWSIPSVTFLRQCRNAYRNLHQYQLIIESWGGTDDTTIG